MVSLRGALSAEVLASMGHAIAHRGPDDSGLWLDPTSGVGLAHQRLSIVDLSPTGHQPMISASGRFVVVFNGEIYNHLELREAIGEHPWRGHSDTETLLATLEAWGVEATLKKLSGMFAIALWDRSNKLLTLARDRLGEKPLYYGWQGDTFLFGSELKALKVHPAFRGEINRDAIALLLRYNCIPAPHSIYRGIGKLPAGTFIQLPLGRGIEFAKTAQPQAYWSLIDTARRGQADLFQGNDEDAVGELELVLGRAVGLQMMADVPLGAFLSGGIDSSTVVALMQAQSSRPIKTFTIGFHERDYNEAEHAKAVANHLGTEHTELYVTSSQAQAVIPRLPALYDEPFSDSSQIPTFLVSQIARESVKVALSGDGGDELFGGYNRYTLARALWKKVAWLPWHLRTRIAARIGSISPAAWDALYEKISVVLPTHQKLRLVGDKAHKFSDLLGARQPREIYQNLISHWKFPSDIVIGATEPSTLWTDGTHWEAVSVFEHQMMLLDAVSYLPDDILVKVDRAAMSVGLETRAPMLDHRVAEFAWRLPLSMKIRGNQSKWALRQLLYKYVPRKMIERPKMGFGVPIDQWLRGPLRDWAEELLDARRLKREGFFHPEPIRRKWEEHLTGRNNWQYYLWDVLMFQSWLEHVEANA